MEQTVAQGAGLTPRQKQLLDLAVCEPYILKTFYLSGGTALASWYLHHRESLDLDFFSLRPFDYERINRWFRENQQKIGYKHITVNEDYGFLTVNLRYPNDTFLKIDFNHYSLAKLSPGIHWLGLEIDSLLDITVNKLQTVADLPRTRDYVDLYFILKNNSFSWRKLIIDTHKKFPVKIIEPYKLAKNFLKVGEYTDFPKMLVPFDPREMEDFFIGLAKSLKKDIFKE